MAQFCTNRGHIPYSREGASGRDQAGKEDWYGGNEEEGVREDDRHQPPRFFAHHTEAFMKRAIAPFFAISSFKTIALENRAWHFQSMVLRRRKQEWT